MNKKIVMNEMTITEAFEVLGIPLDANSDALITAYRDKSRLWHPDVPGGNEQAQKKLNEAREVAEAVIAGKSALIALRLGEPVLKIERAMTLQKAMRDFESSEKRILRSSTRSFQLIKHTTFIFAAVCGGIAWFGKDIFPVLFTSISSADPFIKLMSVTFAAMGAFAAFFVKMIESNLSVYVERIENKRNCAKELAAALKFQDRVMVNESDILSSIGKAQHSDDFTPLVFLFRGVSEKERLHLLLLKAVSHGLLLPDETGELQLEETRSYQLTYKPSLFKPKTEDSPKTTFTKEQEAKGGVVMGVFMFFIFGTICGLLIAFKHQYWAILPGFLGVGGFATFASEATTLRQLKREARHSVISKTAVSETVSESTEKLEKIVASNSE